MSTSPSVFGSRVLCPSCGCHAQLLSVTRAAQLAGVSRRTVYNYVEEGSVYALRLAGKTLRVCAACLLQDDVPNERIKVRT
jgi:excisionase family DNA binding protein